jgi:hypothetical protein
MPLPLAALAAGVVDALAGPALVSSILGAAADALAGPALVSSILGAAAVDTLFLLGAAVAALVRMIDAAHGGRAARPLAMAPRLRWEVVVCG